MSEFVYLIPEAIVVLTLGFVVLSEITYHEERVRSVFWVSVLGLGAALLEVAASYSFGAQAAFGKTLALDGFSLFFKLFFLVLALATVLQARQSREIGESRKTEYYAIVLASVLGMMFVASSTDILFTTVALLAVNGLGGYLAAYKKDCARSTEAGVKLLFFMGVSFAFLAFGLALLFAHTHTFNLYEIHDQLAAHPPSGHGLMMSFALLFFAFCIQIGAFPFHFWLPDVAEGSPTPSSSFLTIGFRGVGFAVLLRLVLVLFTQAPASGAAPGTWETQGGLAWPGLVELVAVTTMLGGAFLAFRQTSAKRMVGALTIAQSGFFLIGLLVLDQLGVAAILYNMVVELFALAGCFAVLSTLVDRFGSDRFIDLRGRLGDLIPESICLILFLLCLVGVPPLPGFIGKFTLIGVAIRHGHLALGVVGILTLILSSIAIARLSFQLVGHAAESEVVRVSPENWRLRSAFLIGTLTPIFGIALFSEGVLRWAGRSLGFILW